MSAATTDRTPIYDDLCRALGAPVEISPTAHEDLAATDGPEVGAPAGAPTDPAVDATV